MVGGASIVPFAMKTDKQFSKHITGKHLDLQLEEHRACFSPGLVVKLDKSKPNSSWIRYDLNPLVQTVSPPVPAALPALSIPGLGKNGNVPISASESLATLLDVHTCGERRMHGLGTVMGSFVTTETKDFVLEMIEQAKSTIEAQKLEALSLARNLDLRLHVAEDTQIERNQILLAFAYFIFDVQALCPYAPKWNQSKC